MAAFEFLKNNISKKWTILAPRRAKRPNFAEASLGKPDVALGTESICPFCPDQLDKEPELYSVKGEDGQWSIKVVPNKFPFADIHELIIHTREHGLSLAMLPEDHIQKIINVYKHRFNEHSVAGQVYIFKNHGQKAGESIPHSHTQIAVIPEKVYLDMPLLSSVEKDLGNGLQTPHFVIVCPQTSQWPDEVWIAPKARSKSFGEINDLQMADLAHALSSLIRMYDLRYKKDFPFNFYIYPGPDWYLRIIPRNKVLGGLEVGTNVFVNTQSPTETMEFIKAHFLVPDDEQIPEADYHHTV